MPPISIIPKSMMAHETTRLRVNSVTRPGSHHIKISDESMAFSSRRLSHLAWVHLTYYLNVILILTAYSDEESCPLTTCYYCKTFPLHPAGTSRCCWLAVRIWSASALHCCRVRWCRNSRCFDLSTQSHQALSNTQAHSIALWKHQTHNHSC